MAQMQKNQKEWKFGEIMPIGRDDYSREVTEASKVDEPGGSGTGVVVFLYKDGFAELSIPVRKDSPNLSSSDPPCVQLRSQLELMARRYPRTKFVSIVGNKCIENYPDRLQPTLILYRAGEVAAQVVSWGKDRAREPQGEIYPPLSPPVTEKQLPELEALLVVSKVVSMEHRINDVDSRPKRNDEELSEEELLSSLNIRSSNQSTKDSRIRKNVTVEDDDSDFDL